MSRYGGETGLNRGAECGGKCLESIGTLVLGVSVGSFSILVAWGFRLASIGLYGFGGGKCLEFTGTFGFGVPVGGFSVLVA